MRGLSRTGTTLFEEIENGLSEAGSRDRDRPVIVALEKIRQEFLQEYTGVQDLNEVTFLDLQAQAFCPRCKGKTLRSSLKTS